MEGVQNVYKVVRLMFFLGLTIFYLEDIPFSQYIFTIFIVDWNQVIFEVTHAILSYMYVQLRSGGFLSPFEFCNLFSSKLFSVEVDDK